MNKGRFLKFLNILQLNYGRRLQHHVLKLRLVQPSFSSLWLAIVPPLLIVKALSHKEEKKKKTEDLIHAADDLYEAAAYDKLFELLHVHEASDEPEILWRVARSLFEKSRFLSSDKEKLEMLENALQIVTRSIELDEKCGSAHRWRAILLDFVHRYKGIKSRLTQSFICRHHMEKAVECNPNDSTSHYLLGEWCYAFADLPWYQKKIAAILFTSPPVCSYEEAYSHFETGEKENPGFYSKNLLMMGKCLLKLNDKHRAIYYLKKVYDYPIKTPDDREAHEEASKLLKEHGVIS